MIILFLFSFLIFRKDYLHKHHKVISHIACEDKLYDLAIARQLEVFMDRILTVWAFYSVQPMDLLKMQTHSLIPPTIRNTGENGLVNGKIKNLQICFKNFILYCS